MIKSFFCWYRAGLLCVVLMLGACSSTTFFYDRLDFLLPWYVDDYVDLDRSQKQYLDGLLTPFLAWHRAEELPAYLTIVEGIESSLNQPQTPATVAAVFGEFENAWIQLEGKSLDWLLDLGAQLTDEQIAELMENLWERQEELEEEYLERTDEEFFEDNYDQAKDNASEYLGTLSDKQRELLHQYSRSLLRADSIWLRDRAQWLTDLGTLLERKSGWQQRVREGVATRRKNASDDYRRILDYNLNASYVLIAKLMDGRSEQQDQHLRERLSSLQEDLRTLIAEGRATEDKALAESPPG